MTERAAIESSKVESAGGKLILPKTSIGEFGFIAQAIDTEGNRHGYMSVKMGWEFLRTNKG